MVGRWKKSWEKKGEEGLHHWFSLTVRESLIAYWQREDHQNKSNNSKDACSASGSRSTHNSGRTLFVARGRQLSAPRRRGKVSGIDSLLSHIDTSSSFRGTSSQSQDSQDVAQLKDKLYVAEQKVTCFEQKLAHFDQLFGYLSRQDPNLAAMLQDPGTTDRT